MWTIMCGQLPLAQAHYTKHVLYKMVLFMQHNMVTMVGNCYFKHCIPYLTHAIEVKEDIGPH
jgi:hypothetical protein